MPEFASTSNKKKKITRKLSFPLVSNCFLFSTVFTLKNNQNKFWLLLDLRFEMASHGKRRLKIILYSDIFD